ncbi:MAG: GNAT family N-acetyltransferase [Bacteroidetes bacterium]|nr:GNAT family N-acetyltransferase [Bacteroidota bacterium]
MNQLDMTSLLTITHLEKEDTATINTIADWYHSEWGTPIVKTWERLQTQSAENTIVQIIARMDDVLVGTGGLRAEVNIFQIHPHLRIHVPWIALLYVQPDFRNRQIGSHLLSHLEAEARQRGHSSVYLYTFTAESLYERAGYTSVERLDYKGHDTVVMMKNV